jgi:acyl carrier protein
MTPQPAIDLRAIYLRSEVLRLLGYILGRTIGEQENPSRPSEPGWDSLKHIELVFLVEDHFGVRFSERELAEVEDAEQIVQALEKRRAT